MLFIFTLFLKLFAGLSLLALVVVLSLLFEGIGRRLGAFVQGRGAPPLMQPAFDLAKLAGKESVVPRYACAWLFNSAPLLALIAAAMVFLYIPMGRFPPVLGTDGDLILIVTLLMVSVFVSLLGGLASAGPFAVLGCRRAAAMLLGCALPLGIVISTMAWTAWRLGLPGAPFSLEPFAAKSVWSELGTVGIFGLACLCLAYVGMIPMLVGLKPVPFIAAEAGPESWAVEYGGMNLALLRLTSELRFFAVICLLAVFFFPVSSSSLWGWSGLGAAVFDFFLFGFKIFCLQMAFVAGAAYCEGCFKHTQAVRLCFMGVLPLSLAGMLLLSFDFLLR